MSTYKTAWTPNRYPQARRSGHVDVYKSETKGEVKVPDPYNWLEENTPETERWVDEQEAFTRKYLDQNPYREKLEKAIEKNFNYARFSAPSLKKDGRWYWSYNTGLQAQSVIWRSKDSTLPDFSKDPEAGEVFFDTNLLSEDGTASIVVNEFSPCGKYYAYALSLSGSDFTTIYVRSTDSPLRTIETRRVDFDKGRLEDQLRFVKFTAISWTHDSKGFFYQRLPDRDSHGASIADDKAGTETDADKNAMLCYHRLGTPQSEDIVIEKAEEFPEWMFGAEVTEVDGKYVVVSVVRDTSRTNLLWIADLEQTQLGSGMKWIKPFNEFKFAYELVGNDGTKFYLRTNQDAPQYKIICVDIADPSFKQSDLIPEQKNAFLDHVTMADGDKFIICYKRNVKDEIHIHGLDGKHLEHVAPDYVGTVELRSKRHQPFFSATLTGFTTPGSIGRYEFKAPEKKWNIYRETKIAGLATSDFTAEQVWYASKDGTKVPMFIVRHKDTPKDGSAPAIQYGYGGFLISVNPFFSVAILTFIQKYHAVLAVPNIRGGGEFGDKWHEGGMLDKKTNCFDDFIAATEYLKSNKIASTVAINGGSNGGLLVAACINRAPEGTFGAAVAEVGVMDMLKFHKFTIGRAWTSDFGNPDDPHDFDYIYEYSPVHNVPKDKLLPPTVLHTADHDDRVVPLHSFKLAAALQYAQPHNPNPLLIRIDKKAGHGAGKNTQQKIKEAADKWGFVAQSMGLEYHDN